MGRVITITQEQADYLAALRATRDLAIREHDIAYTAILAGHGITRATSYEIAGTQMTVAGTNGE